jgi:site-specific recombinase XerD
VSALIDMFLDAAEAGEARGRDGRPYSDDELAEFEWAFAGYVEGQFADLNASAVRGRHIFRLIDELEDAGMPRSRLRSVVTAVRELFDYAAEIDLVQVNPATYVSLPPDERRTRTRLRETLETRMPPASPDASGGAFTGSVISERAIWMSVKMVALIFICIALVLVAESV